MEPVERMARGLAKLAFIAFALVVSIVFDEFGHGVVGFVIFVVGLVAGAIALKVRKTL